MSKEIGVMKEDVVGRDKIVANTKNKSKLEKGC